MVTEEEINKHKPNSFCDCSKCFVKSIMKENNCSMVEVLQSIEKMKEEGVLVVEEYDNTGFPLIITRTITKKKTKELIDKLR